MMSPHHTQAPRAIDCLYVHPAVYLAQGGHECYNTATGKIINHHCVIMAPITAAIIAVVEAAAHAEKKLHFKSKHGMLASLLPYKY